MKIDKNTKGIALTKNKTVYGPELVPDPDFNDPNAWNIVTHEGVAEVVGGKLVCTAWRGNTFPVGMATPIIGRTVYFEVDVEVTGVSALAAIDYGNVAGLENFIEVPEGDPPSQHLWISPLGVGLFSGTGVVVNTQPLSASMAFATDNLTINRISIREIKNSNAQTNKINKISTMEINV